MPIIYAANIKYKLKHATKGN